MSKKYKTQQEIEAEIMNILNNNKIDDLKKFLEKRQCLNNTNQILSYMFHVIQSAGILTTTIAAGYNMKELVWIGIGMNLIASLINIFEKTNDSISKKLFKNIQSIKNGTYIDEAMMVDIDSKSADNKSYSEKYNYEKVEKIENQNKIANEIENKEISTTDNIDSQNIEYA